MGPASDISLPYSSVVTLSSEEVTTDLREMPEKGVCSEVYDFDTTCHVGSDQKTRLFIHLDAVNAYSRSRGHPKYSGSLTGPVLI